MNLTRCEQGHYYDGEKYSSCPHCASGAGMQMDSATEAFYGDVGGTPTKPVSDVVTEAADMGGVTVDTKLDDTLPIGGIPADTPTVGAETAALHNTVAWPGAGTTPLDNEYGGATPNQNTEDEDDDHTIGFFGDINEELFSAKPKEERAAEKEEPKANQVSASASQPCVGWLVAIGGTHIGQDFHLKVGKNFIGRGQNMDVALTGDKSVSREKQAIVVYEPKQHLYLIQPGEASSLVYCNNEVVLNPKMLNPYDIITVGEVNLLFIPLCGKDFNWNDLLHKEA